MRTEGKSEWKGAFKALIAIVLIGVAIGVGYATVVISDTSITIDDNTVPVEGDFTTWTHKWTNGVPNGLSSTGYIGFLIDERSDVLTVTWLDDSANYRFGVYNLADFSAVFESTSGSDYSVYGSDLDYASFFTLGNTGLDHGGRSRSLQSYVLLARLDEMNIEVWRGGASALWTHNITVDEAGAKAPWGEISLTGKWVLIGTDSEKLMLYEGS